MQIFGPRIHQGFLLRENRPHQTIPNHRMTQDETKSNTNIKNDSSNNGNTTTTPWVGQIGGLPLYIYTAAGAAPTKTRRHQEVIFGQDLSQTRLGAACRDTTQSWMLLTQFPIDSIGNCVKSIHDWVVSRHAAPTVNVQFYILRGITTNHNNWNLT